MVEAYDGSSGQEQLYNDEFYANLADSSVRSARQIVPRVLQLVECNSVVDVGCGTGEWLMVFRELGVTDVLGIDGPHISRQIVRIPPGYVVALDLRKAFRLERRFDLALSLEVGEHLPADCAKTFVTSLTQLSPVILFSASIPYQAGIGHINEQWQDYWIELFKQNGFVLVDCLRRDYWSNADVAWWYKQNLLMFVCEKQLPSYCELLKLYERDTASFIRLVHPDIYLHHATKAHELTRILDKAPVRLMLTIKRSIDFLWRLAKDV